MLFQFARKIAVALLILDIHALWLSVLCPVCGTLNSFHTYDHKFNNIYFHEKSPPYVAAKRILIPKGFPAILAHHHISIGLAAAKKRRVLEHRRTFSVQSVLHQTCACPLCAWREHAKTAAGNSTGRFSSLPLPPVVVRCHCCRFLR